MTDTKTIKTHQAKMILDEMDRRDLTLVALHIAAVNTAIVVVEREGPQPFVCWVVHIDTNSATSLNPMGEAVYCNWGHYCDDLNRAMEHYHDRVRRYDSRVVQG